MTATDERPARLRSSRPWIWAVLLALLALRIASHPGAATHLGPLLVKAMITALAVAILLPLLARLVDRAELTDDGVLLTRFRRKRLVPFSSIVAVENRAARGVIVLHTATERVKLDRLVTGASLYGSLQARLPAHCFPALPVLPLNCTRVRWHLVTIALVAALLTAVLVALGREAWHQGLSAGRLAGIGLTSACAASILLFSPLSYRITEDAISVRFAVWVRTIPLARLERVDLKTVYAGGFPALSLDIRTAESRLTIRDGSVDVPLEDIHRLLSAKLGPSTLPPPPAHDDTAALRTPGA